MSHGLTHMWDPMSKANKQNRQTYSRREQTYSCQRKGAEVKGLSKRQNSQTDSNVVRTRGKGWGGG